MLEISWKNCIVSLFDTKTYENIPKHLVWQTYKQIIKLHTKLSECFLSAYDLHIFSISKSCLRIAAHPIAIVRPKPLQFDTTSPSVRFGHLKEDVNSVVCEEFSFISNTNDHLVTFIGELSAIRVVLRMRCFYSNIGYVSSFQNSR